MPHRPQAAKIPILLKPEERRRLLAECARARVAPGGLGLAMAVEELEVCWLSGGELELLAQGLRPGEPASWQEHMLARQAGRSWQSLGGLSLERFARLLAADWREEQGPLRLSRDLPPESLQSAPLWRRARSLLRAVRARQPLPADSQGRLPMGLVLALREDPAWSGSARPNPWDRRGLPHEDNVAQVRLVRALLQRTGLLRLARGRFSLSRRGRAMMQPEDGGELFACLFAACLHQGAGLPAAEDQATRRFQRAMAFHLYRLWLLPRQEMSLEQLAARVALPPWFYGPSPPDSAAWLLLLVRGRLVAPLMEFGLLARRPAAPGRHPRGQETFRATPLLPRFLRFAP